MSLISSLYIDARESSSSALPIEDAAMKPVSIANLMPSSESRLQKPPASPAKIAFCFPSATVPAGINPISFLSF
ncbi:MAG: hypothetical protein DRJ44_00005 [Thermoprotei archaeon]|nr:MAG: hypothetical protein DRJ44_00005 [Thermoprotei archaeon]